MFKQLMASLYIWGSGVAFGDLSSLFVVAEVVSFIILPGRSILNTQWLHSCLHSHTTQTFTFAHFHILIFKWFFKYIILIFLDYYRFSTHIRKEMYSYDNWYLTNFLALHNLVWMNIQLWNWRWVDIEVHKTLYNN